jgi:plastocyanin
MRRALSVLVTFAVALVLAVSGTAATPKLTGASGPALTITLKRGGQIVKTLKAGTYTIVVADKSSVHNFHLFGPGVNKKTSVPFTGTQIWTVKLRAGTYIYQCDAHAYSGMKGMFTVI